MPTIITETIKDLVRDAPGTDKGAMMYAVEFLTVMFNTSNPELSVVATTKNPAHMKGAVHQLLARRNGGKVQAIKNRSSDMCVHTSCMDLEIPTAHAGCCSASLGS